MRTTTPGISPEVTKAFAASSTPVKSGAWAAASVGQRRRRSRNATR